MLRCFTEMIKKRMLNETASMSCLLNTALLTTLVKRKKDPAVCPCTLLLFCRFRSLLSAVEIVAMPVSDIGVWVICFLCSRRLQPCSSLVCVTETATNVSCMFIVVKVLLVCCLTCKLCQVLQSAMSQERQKVSWTDTEKDYVPYLYK